MLSEKKKAKLDLTQQQPKQNKKVWSSTAS
jgi:hypothetical protein